MKNRMPTVDFYEKYVRLNFIYYIELCENFTNIENIEAEILTLLSNGDEVDMDVVEESILNLCKEATAMIMIVEKIGVEASERANSDPSFRSMLESGTQLAVISELSSRLHMVYATFHLPRLTLINNSMTDSDNTCELSNEEFFAIRRRIKERIKKYNSLTLQDLGDKLLQAQKFAQVAAVNADDAIANF